MTYLSAFSRIRARGRLKMSTRCRARSQKGVFAREHFTSASTEYTEALKPRLSVRSSQGAAPHSRSLY